MLKKGIALGVILLLVSVSVIPSTGRDIEQSSISPLYDSKTLYVGGSGPGNYTRIQDAIQKCITLIFFIGWVNNFTQNGTKYSFRSYNMRSLEFYYGHSRREISYEFFKGWWSHSYNGYNWKGIVRPNFICGILYDFD